MSKVTKAFTDHFNINSEPKALPPGQEEPVETAIQEEIESESDLALSRKTMRALLDKGTDLLDMITQIAEDSESSRAFEVAGQIFEKLSKTAVDLAKLTENRGKQANKPTGSTHIHFEGTTYDMLRTLRRLELEDAEVVDAEIIIETTTTINE